MAQQPGQLTFDDGNHEYRLGRQRVKSASATGKLAVESFALDGYDRRMIITGLIQNPPLIEAAAAAIGNNDALARVADDAKQAAGAYRNSARGLQMHWVLQCVLSGRTDLIMTAQQRADADALRRTLDRYRLDPTEWVENFIVYPEFLVAGRFDAILRKVVDDTLVMVDLKSGINAVKYPQSTACQLALYQNAPWMAASVDTKGDLSVVTEWTHLPENLYRDHGYVLLLQPGEPVGTLHSVNTQHGWAAAQLALRIVNWRREFSYGKDIVREVPIPKASSPNRR